MSKHPRGSQFDSVSDDGGNGAGLFNAEALVPQRTYVTGMMMALAGILMFFMALVSAYVVRKGMPNSDWMAMPELPRILWLNTCVLLASSAALVFARARSRDDDETGFRRWWSASTVLGVCFLAGQIVAWRELVAGGVYLATNASSSFFYLFTAAHGLHLAGGLAALIWILMRPTRRLTRGTAAEVVSMYWHFMDGIWIFLFLVLLIER